MRKLIVFIVPLLFLASCQELKSKFELMAKISIDLNKNFNHHGVNTSFGWGTEEKDNYLTVTFYDFPVDSVSEDQFEKMATEVSDYLYGNYPELSEMSYVEVRFTDEPVLENATSFFIYRRERGDSIKLEEELDQI